MNRLRINGVQPVDEEWRKMKKVWDACKEADIDPPGDVHDYFEGQDPNDLPEGLEVDLGSRDADGQDNGHYRSKAITSVDREMACGVDINLEQLRKEHPNLSTIRIWVSW